MAVLHLIDSLSAGGAQTSLQALMESGQAPNHYLVALRQTPDAIPIRKARLYICESGSRFSVRPLFLIRRVIGAHKIQLLHCHLLRSQVLGLFLRQYFFRDLKLVFQEHGQILGSNQDRAAENFVYRAFIRFAASRVDHFVVSSQAARDALVAAAPAIKHKHSLVLAPIRELTEARGSNSSLRSTLGIRRETFVVGFAGRLIEAKGWRDLVEATSRLRPQRDVFLLLAGEGPDRARMLDLLSQGALADRHRWLGFQQDMRRFFDALDCVVVPSHREAQGLVQIEAQACGIPVVAANVPGMRETLVNEENALLFEVQNATEMAQQINRLIEDRQLRERLVTAGRLNARRFSAAEFAQRLEEVYRKLGL